MPRPYRRQRLASLLVEFLSDLLRNEARDPRLGFVSITRVDVSGRSALRDRPRERDG